MKRNSETTPTPELLSDTLKEINRLIDEYLFGKDSWPIEPRPIGERLIELGLEERDTSTTTRLGRAVEVDLLSAFLGVRDKSDIPIVMEEYALFTRHEANWWWDQLEAGSKIWPLLRSRLQFAYRAHVSQPRDN